MAALTNETPQPPTGQQFQSEFPDLFLRIELHQPIDLDRLKSSWNLQPDAITDSRGVIPIDDRRSVYLPPIDLLDHPKDRHGVQVFCIGPKALVEEAAELEGASAPISLALKKLLDRSNRDFDFSLLTTPRFLFSDGQAVLQALPPRMQQLLESMLGRESRGLLVQSHSNGQWYWEAQALGAKDSEAADMLKNWTQQASQASSQAEQRLLHENPHPFWRALALRFPQMLRIWYQSSRFGIEDGVVLANGYLPATAPSNLAAATWISMQDGALLATTPESGNSGPLSDVTMTPDSPSAAPLDMKEFLNRQIRLSFEQEPIEQALALIGEEANDSLPAGVRKVRFELDGSAFEKAGITRNQQIRQFKAEGISVRQALTELARRGNPASNVSDTRDTKQMLVWIVKQVPSINENGIVMLTTRDQALSEHYVLPEEFAEVK